MILSIIMKFIITIKKIAFSIIMKFITMTKKMTFSMDVVKMNPYNVVPMQFHSDCQNIQGL